MNNTSDTLLLNGRALTVDDVARVARGAVQVDIDPACCAQLEATRAMILEMATDRDLPRIYGFNTGLGMNKDWDITPDEMERFNRAVIYSHSAAIPPEASEAEVRAVLVVRLNCFLSDATGAQPDLVYRYRDFLNHRIHPVLPKRGSIGESDLVVLAHIGLAVIGEGEVIFRGERMPAAKALAKVGLAPLVLGCKASLAIVNASALCGGLGALLLHDVAAFMDAYDLIFALSLEGFGGNTSPLDPAAHRARPVPGPAQTAERVRAHLEGSFLWQPGVTASLQDPLCYRSGCHVNGAVRDALGYVWTHHTLQINCSDDNPCVLAEERRIISCSNFDPTTLAIGFEMLGLALSHVSKNMCYQLIKLDTAYFSRLPRFLSPDGSTVMAYTTNQKTYTALDAENRLLSNPVTADYISVSGDVEDHATNLPLIISKTEKMLDNLRYMLGTLAFHSAQAVDLRGKTPLGKRTDKAYQAVRAHIPFLDQDRVVTTDIRKAYTLVQSGVFEKIAREE